MNVPKKIRMRGQFEKPNGLIYSPHFISREEEQTLLEILSGLNYEEVILHGQAAKRTVKHYGYHYDYQRVELVPGEPFPSFLQNLADRCADFAEIDKKAIIQCLISKYPKKSTIGWHTDKFIFGPKVIGISLLSSCQMRFQRKLGYKRFVYEMTLDPCSIYVLSGEARYKWQHSIPPTTDLRYSITFRTLKKS